MAALPSTGIAQQREIVFGQPIQKTGSQELKFGSGKQADVDSTQPTAKLNFISSPFRARALPFKQSWKSQHDLKAWIEIFLFQTPEFPDCLSLDGLSSSPDIHSWIKRIHPV